MGIGKRVREAREHLGYTQKELGDLIGVTASAVTNYENETSHPKEPILYKLINVLHVDANYLFQDCFDSSNANFPSPTQVETDQGASTDTETTTGLVQEQKEKDLSVLVGDELWESICKDKKKYAFMRLISILNSEELDRMEKLLDAALLLPKE